MLKKHVVQHINSLKISAKIFGGVFYYPYLCYVISSLIYCFPLCPRCASYALRASRVTGGTIKEGRLSKQSGEAGA